MSILAGIGGIGGIFAETISKGFPVIHAEEKSAKKVNYLYFVNFFIMNANLIFF